MSELTETRTVNQPEADTCQIGWKEGGSGILAGILAALCCAVPPLLGILGLTGAAALLGSMPFTYHLIFQWIALGIIVPTWGWFVWNVSRMSNNHRWSAKTLGIGFVLLLVSAYVVKTWYAHIFLMG